MDYINKTEEEQIQSRDKRYAYARKMLEQMPGGTEEKIGFLTAALVSLCKDEIPRYNKENKTDILSPVTCIEQGLINLTEDYDLPTITAALAAFLECDYSSVLGERGDIITDVELFSMYDDTYNAMRWGSTDANKR